MATFTISLAGDSDDLELPAGPPTKPPGRPVALSEKDRNDITDIIKMEKKFDEYSSASGALGSLHLDWLTYYNGWSNRLDKVNGAAQIIDKTLEVILTDGPQDMGVGEKWADRLAWIIPSATGGVGLVVAYVKYVKAKNLAAPIGVLSRAEKARRMANLKNAKSGLYVSAATFALGAYSAIKDGIKRLNFLMDKMVEYEAWFDKTIKSIETMKEETENNILPRIDDLADALGVLVKGDPDQTYRNVIETLDGLASSLAEYEAQYRIATRMICKGQAVFNDAQINLATNLDLQAIQDRRSEIALDQSICDRFG